MAEEAFPLLTRALISLSSSSSSPSLSSSSSSSFRALISLSSPQKSSNGDNSICFILHSPLSPHKSAIHINFPQRSVQRDKAKCGEKSDKCFTRIALSGQTPNNMTKRMTFLKIKFPRVGRASCLYVCLPLNVQV